MALPVLSRSWLLTITTILLAVLRQRYRRWAGLACGMSTSHPVGVSMPCVAALGDLQASGAGRATRWLAVQAMCPRCLGLSSARAARSDICEVRLGCRGGLGHTGTAWRLERVASSCSKIDSRRLGPAAVDAGVQSRMPWHAKVRVSCECNVWGCCRPEKPAVDAANKQANVHSPRTHAHQPSSASGRPEMQLGRLAGVHCALRRTAGQIRPGVAARRWSKQARWSKRRPDQPGCRRRTSSPWTMSACSNITVADLSWHCLCSPAAGCSPSQRFCLLFFDSDTGVGPAWLAA